MEILDVISAIAEEQGLNFLLIGGHAVNAYGEGRQTGDIDFLVKQKDREGWKNLILSLRYKLYHEHKAFIQFSAPQLGMWPIDLMLVEDETFTKMSSLSWNADFGGRYAIRVPTVQHLIALKLHAVKQSDRDDKLKDLRDIIQLTKIKELDILGDDFKALCIKYGSKEVYDKICEYGK